MDAGGTTAQGIAHGDVLAWLQTSVVLLENSQDLLNRANVFPVADSDTGTNMLLTMRGALKQAQTATGPGPHESLVQASVGALTHAHGNSGIILAEYLRGFTFAFVRVTSSSTEKVLFPEALALALDAGASRAYKAVALPVEGTILTAASCAARSAQETAGSLEVGDSSAVLSVLDAAILGATQALDRSHEELEVLAHSGVLDAGAYGFVLVLSALRNVVAGKPVVARESLVTVAGTPGVGEPQAEITDGEFEVMCLVELRGSAKIYDESAEQVTTSLRAVLAQLGESVVVSGGLLNGTYPSSNTLGPDTLRALWNVHVHTDSPDQVLNALEEASALALKLSRIVVRNLRQQVIANAEGREPLKLVSCVNGPLLAVDLSRAGAIVCIERSQPLVLEDIERAVSEVHHGSAALSDRPAPLEERAVIIAHSDSLVKELVNSPLKSGFVRAFDDVQIIAATSAVVSEWESGESTQEALARIGRECVKKLVTIRIDSLERATMAPLINELESDRRGEIIPIITVLTDLGCPPNAVHDLVDGIERKNEDAEVIVLSSGRPGNGLTASVEWVDE